MTKREDPQPRSIIAGIPDMTQAEFLRFQRFIRAECGIFLGDTKRDLLVARLSRRLREIGCASFADYYRRVVEDGDPEETTHFLDAVSTNQTHFFREPLHFDFLRDRVFPEWISARETSGKRSFRIWSAGCSTGEEPYSLSMSVLRWLSPPPGHAVDILGTDLSTRALAAAHRAEWSLDKAREIPIEFARRYLVRAGRVEDGLVTLAAEVRGLVRFARLNLAEQPRTSLGTFDAIFCRNVLIYFHPSERRRIVERLLARLVPGGYLFLGHSESLLDMSDVVRSVGSTVYRHAPVGIERKSPRLLGSAG